MTKSEKVVASYTYKWKDVKSEQKKLCFQKIANASVACMPLIYNRLELHVIWATVVNTSWKYNDSYPTTVLFQATFGTWKHEVEGLSENFITWGFQ